MRGLKINLHWGDTEVMTFRRFMRLVKRSNRIFENPELMDLHTARVYTSPSFMTMPVSDNVMDEEILEGTKVYEFKTIDKASWKEDLLSCSIVENLEYQGFMNMAFTLEEIFTKDRPRYDAHLCLVRIAPRQWALLDATDFAVEFTETKQGIKYLFYPIGRSPYVFNVRK